MECTLPLKRMITPLFIDLFSLKNITALKFQRDFKIHRDYYNSSPVNTTLQVVYIWLSSKLASRILTMNISPCIIFINLKISAALSPYKAALDHEYHQRTQRMKSLPISSELSR